MLCHALLRQQAEVENFNNSLIKKEKGSIDLFFLFLLAARLTTRLLFEQMSKFISSLITFILYGNDTCLE